MKFASILVVGVMLGGNCSVGEKRRVPPSEAERQGAQQPVVTERAVPGDPWEGLPEQCRALSESCADCDEVERMRRQILLKKCVPVCGTYLENTDMLGTLPQQGIELIQTEALCGKSGATCSPVQESACGHAVGYVGVGAAFEQHWAESKTPDGELWSKFHADFLVPYLDRQAEIVAWADDNNVDPAPLLAAAGQLMAIATGPLVDEVRAALGESERLVALDRLLELVRGPGDPASFTARRADIELALRP